MAELLDTDLPIAEIIDGEIKATPYFEDFLFQIINTVGGEGGGVVSDHTNLSNIGTNTHPQIDTGLTNSASHIADVSIHTEDNLLAHLAGVETFTGAKTFTGAFTTLGFDDNALVTALTLTVNLSVQPVSFKLPTETTTNLNDITAGINTSAAKEQGTTVYNSTTDNPVYAVGNTDGSIWVDGAGTTVHTPV